MSITDFVTVIAQVSGLVFVVTSMLAMGMSLLMAQIVAPLKNARLVLLALVGNFILAPLLAYLLVSIIPLDQPVRVGLIVLATAAGAPFLPKLVQGAKGNIAMAVGLMVLLMVVTVVYMPVVLPLLLPDVTVNPWDIAKSLIALMLVPLALGLLIKAQLPELAAQWQPTMNKVSSVAILILVVTGLGLNVANILSLIGSGGIAAVLLFIGGCLAIGMLLGGRDSGVRSVMGLGTAQRNVSAVILVSAQNFAGTTTLPFVLVTAVLLLLTLLPLARWLGRRVPTDEAETPQAVATL